MLDFWGGNQNIFGSKKKIPKVPSELHPFHPFLLEHQIFFVLSKPANQPGLHLGPTQAPSYRTKGDGFATSLIGSQAFLKLWICPGGIVDEPRKQKTVQPGGGMDKVWIQVWIYMDIKYIYICTDGHEYVYIHKKTNRQLFDMYI